MNSIFIHTTNFVHDYTHCSKDSCIRLLQSHQKVNTEIYGPKYKVNVIALPSANRIMMLPFWFCYHVILPNS